ncbi:hypothetical protein [Haploplasma axanthum]|uniref:Lipoprotein n=1 Tax=Haploplasma axanthum TaxID=29552 RepID=A0A449BD99_HAPAX|nr:hypothetical protein [Haploplasma axanthum]VEU80441.1 Uncharacterised protein [Haploplasma axanthum]
MKKSIIIGIVSFFILLILSSCNKKVDDNGEKNFMYTKYIEKNEDTIQNIKIPIIIKEELKVVDLMQFSVSTSNKPLISIKGYKKMATYKEYNLYFLIINISNITDSFVLETLDFRVNNSRIFTYKPKSFVIVKTDYEIIEHDEFKLLTSIIKYNNVPSNIKYRIDSNNFKVIDLKSLQRVERWELQELDKIIGSNITAEILIKLKNIDIDFPLSVTFNFQYIVSDSENNFSYIDNIEIFNSDDEILKEIINGKK